MKGDVDSNFPGLPVPQCELRTLQTRLSRYLVDPALTLAEPTKRTGLKNSSLARDPGECGVQRTEGHAQWRGSTAEEWMQYNDRPGKG